LSTLILLIATAVTAVAMFAVGRATTAPALRQLRADYTHVWHLAHTDELTGLPNRRHARRLLGERLAANQPTTVALLDLDRFKAVNDTHGHHAGDQLLRHTAARLRTAVAAHGGHAARLGGDEFLLILPAGTGDNAAAVADILTRLEQPFTLHPDRYTAVEHLPRASAGIAVTGHSARTWDDLVRQADIALYRTKRAGRWYHLYQPGHDTDHARFDPRSQARLRDLHRTPAGRPQPRRRAGEQS
jgi:diguanylate cyclase (GGDEF)-like protein